MLVLIGTSSPNISFRANAQLLSAWRWMRLCVFTLTEVNVRALQIRQDNPVTLADDLSLQGSINQIRGVRRCGLFDWYYVSLCCEENPIYKVEANCLWEVSQYGACQTLISTEGPLCWGKVTLWVKCHLGCGCHFWNVLVWQWCHYILSVLEIR